MCGLFGSSRLTPSVHKMLPLLALEMETRGKDSWGGSNGYEVVKHSGMISDSWGGGEEFEDWSEGIFHTRGASHGSKTTQENAHPFEFNNESRRVIGMHNGIITNFKQLDQKYPDRKFEVDSMHIYKNILDYGCKQGLKDLEGWMNLVWYDTYGTTGNQPPTLNFARSESFDLHLVTLTGGELVFCSNLIPLQKVSKMMGNPIKTTWKIEEYHHYQLIRREVEDEIEDLGELPFNKKIIVTQTPFDRSGSGSFFPNVSNYYGSRYLNQKETINLDGDEYYKHLKFKNPNALRVCYVDKETELLDPHQILCGECFQKKVVKWKTLRDKRIQDEAKEIQNV